MPTALVEKAWTRIVGKEWHLRMAGIASWSNADKGILGKQREVQGAGLFVRGVVTFPLFAMAKLSCHMPTATLGVAKRHKRVLYGVN